MEALKSVKSFWTSKRKRTQDEILLSSPTDESGEKQQPAEEVLNKAKRQRVDDVSEKRPFVVEAEDDIEGETHRSDTHDEFIDLNKEETKPSPKSNNDQVIKKRRRSERLKSSSDKSSKDNQNNSSADKAQNELGEEIQIEVEGNPVNHLENGEKSPNSNERADFVECNEQEHKLIDLTGVAKQEPILSCRINSISKYAGVSYRNRKKKNWEANIKINGKSYHIGRYDDELEAAVDYARAVYKYHIVENLQMRAVDVPDKKEKEKGPISKHCGVTFNKTMKKWQASTWFEGQKHDIIGWFDTDDDAAAAIEHFHS